MLGYTQLDNRIEIFLEKGDIINLGKGKVTGTYLCREDLSDKNSDKKALLELSRIRITDTIENIIDQLNDTSSMICTIKNNAGSILRMSIGIRPAIYGNLVETGYAESNSEGTRICIYDANRVLYQGNAFDKVTYELLKAYETKQSNKRIKNPGI